MEITAIQMELVEGQLPVVAKADILIDGVMHVGGIKVCQTIQPTGFHVQWPTSDNQPTLVPIDEKVRTVMDAKLMRHFIEDYLPDFVNKMAVAEVEKGWADEA